MEVEPLCLTALASASALAELHGAAWVKALGWIGQAFFSGRVLVQWIASERARRPVAPQIFWWLSMGGALMMSAYSVLRGEVVMLPAYVVTLGIYARNLWLIRLPDSRRESSPLLVVVLGILIAVGPYAVGLVGTQGRAIPELPWLALAIVGEALWIGRFLVQWHHAERHGKSDFPAAFWWITIVGSGALLAYSLHRGDHVFIFGFVTSWVAPARNLMLHHRHLKSAR